MAGHLLLFISALIPKAMASLLTSAVIELSKPENVSLVAGLSVAWLFVLSVSGPFHVLPQVRWKEAVGDNGKADDIILEVQRLWPPFFGGRRICVEVCHYNYTNVCIRQQTLGIVAW